MKTTQTQNRLRAFSLVDVVIIVTVLTLLGVLLVPYLAAVSFKSSRIHCVSRMKQIGLASTVWARDNGGKYPMQVSTNFGGSMELARSGNVISTFRAMSNELSTPFILACPSDFRRQPVKNFRALNGRAVSYFIGLDATKDDPQMLLSGDRNITNDTRVRSGLLELTTNRLSGWTSEIHQRAGNIVLADGSAQHLSTAGLRKAVEDSGMETNRLAIP